jgi:hypothetical protein
MVRFHLNVLPEKSLVFTFICGYNPFGGPPSICNSSAQHVHFLIGSHNHFTKRLMVVERASDENGHEHSQCGGDNHRCFQHLVHGERPSGRPGQLYPIVNREATPALPAAFG